MNDHFIDYSSLVDEAMYEIVRKSLDIISKSDFNGEHHFFISFVTKHPKVKLSDKLRAKYPEEMTIVLQYQFEELKVKEDSFSVILSFDNIKENIEVPFEALTAFADPSVKFGLQFRHYEDEFELEEDEKVIETSNQAFKQTKKSSKDSASKKTEKKNNVVAIDKFRKK